MYQHETWGKLGWLICSKLGCFFPSCAAHVLQCLRVCGCTSCCVVECETVGEGRPRDFNRSEILRLKFVKLKFQDYLILRIFTIYWPFFKSGLASHFLSPWCPWLPGGLCWCFGILWGLSPLIPNKVTPCHTMSHHQSWLIFEPDFLCLRFLMFFDVFWGASCEILCHSRGCYTLVVARIEERAAIAGRCLAVLGNGWQVRRFFWVFDGMMHVALRCLKVSTGSLWCNPWSTNFDRFRMISLFLFLRWWLDPQHLSTCDGLKTHGSTVNWLFEDMELSHGFQMADAVATWDSTAGHSWIIQHPCSIFNHPTIIQQSSNKGIEIIFNHPTKSNKGVELMDFFFLRLNPLDLVTGKLWRRKTTSTASGCTAVMDPRPMGWILILNLWCHWEHDDI